MKRLALCLTLALSCTNTNTAVPVQTDLTRALPAPAAHVKTSATTSAPSSAASKYTAPDSTPSTSTENGSGKELTDEQNAASSGVSPDSDAHPSKPRHYQENACKTTPPKGFVVLSEKIPGLALEIKYATDDNFTGKRLPGYEVADAWLLEKPAEALARVQDSLKEKNLGLVIFDAYRPKRASKAMVDWAHETKNDWVLSQGYVASKSTHNTGTTVDLGLIDLTTGALVEMGTPFDFFGEESHTKNATGQVLENRLTLQKAMRAQGFSPYAKEWWHFGYSVKGAAAIDVPYACGY